MEEKGMFRSSLRGFNKTDVLTYIDSITAAWDEERQALLARTEEAEHRAEAALQQAEEATAQAEQMQQQQAALQEEIEQLRALTDEVAQLREQQQIAENEKKAAEERLHTKEAELNARNQRLRELEEQLSACESLLGRADAIEQHMDGIVRPFIEQANRQANDTLNDVGAVLTALLSQLHELQDSVDKKRHTLQQQKAQQDHHLSSVLSDWLTKAKENAEQTASLVTRFFR